MAPTTAGEGSAARAPWWADRAAWGHLALVLWFFGPLLAGSRVLFFRDIAFLNVPDGTFIARALRAGVWPLWYPDCDAGAPFLATYPFDLILLGLGGQRLHMAAGPPLHLLLTMTGMTLLARRLGLAAWPAWAAGALWGLSGWSLSTLFYPNFHAGAWAPWVVLAVRNLAERPGARATGLLALATALQVSTLGGEVVAQTAVLALLLFPRRPSPKVLAGGVSAAAVALLLAAPAIFGARALVAGSARAGVTDPAQVLSYSVAPPALLDFVLPRFFGDFHGFTDRGSWGQPLFDGLLPYVLSLYLGPVLLFAAFSRRLGLWAAVGGGLLLALGRHGPFAAVLTALFPMFRNVPVKLAFAVTFGLVLLASEGLHRALREGTRLWLAACAGGTVLLGLGAFAWQAPDPLSAAMLHLTPAFAQGGPFVVRHLWPAALATSGALLLAAGLALRTPSLGPLAAVLAVLDLAIVNGGLNPATTPDFYRLRPELARLLERGSRDERWFTYGAANTPSLRFDPRALAADRDVLRFYLDVQSLLPRTHVLAGLEGAYDADHVGTAPVGAALAVAEADPEHLAATYGRLRLAGVRWLLSFQPLPDALAHKVAEAPLPPALDPLGLYELAGWLPRAFWVPACEAVAADALWPRALAPDFDPRQRVVVAGSCGGTPAAPAADASPAVRYERIDPHTVRVHASTPPGWLVVLDGYHRDWKAEGPEGPVPLLRADGRYRALFTPGGERTFTLTFHPAWRFPALAACALGLALLLWLLARPSTLDLRLSTPGATPR